MKKSLMLLLGTLVLVFAVACGAAEDDGGAAAALSDLSQFPTPTRSQNARATDTPESSEPAAASQPQTDDSASEGGATAEVADLSQEDLQQLRQRLQSGELSQEEIAQVVQQLRAQFGGGREGGGGGRFGRGGGARAVGIVSELDGNTLTVTNELSSVTANVIEETIIRVTSVLSQSELEVGESVRVISERVDGRTLARSVILVPEDQGGSRSRGGGQTGSSGGGSRGRGGGGQFGSTGQGGGGRWLVGTIDSISNNVLTIETAQGPLPVTLDDETIISRRDDGTLSDIKDGMQITVTGAEGDEGVIDARIITLTPAGFEAFAGTGGGGGGWGGRGGSGSGSGSGL